MLLIIFDGHFSNQCSRTWICVDLGSIDKRRQKYQQSRTLFQDTFNAIKLTYTCSMKPESFQLQTDWFQSVLWPWTASMVDLNPLPQPSVLISRDLCWRSTVFHLYKWFLCSRQSRNCFAHSSAQHPSPFATSILFGHFVANLCRWRSLGTLVSQASHHLQIEIPISWLQETRKAQEKIPGSVTWYTDFSNTGTWSLASNTLNSSVLNAEWTESETWTWTLYDFSSSKSIGEASVMEPVYLPMENMPFGFPFSVKAYTKAGFVSTSLATTVVTKEPTGRFSTMLTTDVGENAGELSFTSAEKRRTILMTVASLRFELLSLYSPITLM